MARAPYPSEAAEKLLIRFPPGMREKIADAAQAAGRSMNAEVIARLEASLDDATIDERMNDLEELAAEYERRIASLERRMEDVFHMAGWRDYPGNERD